jgi:hypothetical protein
MSRSRKHTPIFGNGGDSEKNDKRILHGKLRTRLRAAVKKMLLEKSSEEYVVPNYDEVYNVWEMLKDGKGYWVPKKLEDRPDYEKLMRK